MNKKKPGIDRPYTFDEFLSIIKKIAEEKKIDYLDQLDYLLASEKEEQMTSDDIDFRSDTHYGSSEGVYTTFHFTRGRESKHIFTAKTLGQKDEDYIKMHILAANICLIASEYIRKHVDEFNWTGYNVYRVADGKAVPYMWCEHIDNAQKRVEELKQKDVNSFLRDNSTRKTTGKHIETVYKEQLIVENDAGVLFYLYDRYGDIVEHKAKTSEEAIGRIDGELKKWGGLFNADGRLTTEF